MKVAVRGVDLFFDVDGVKVSPDGPWMRDRPTVILLHTGPGADHSLYKEHIGPALTDLAQVVYLDLRGAGRSDWSSPEHWTIDAWVDDLEAFCETLEVERPVLLGTSTGGVIALAHAARHPDRVERLVLVSTVARYVHSRSIAVFDRIAGPEAGEVAARYYADPTEAHFAEFLRVCVPLYTRKPISPDTVARMQMNTALITHWDRTGARAYDVREEAAGVRMPRPSSWQATTTRRRRSAESRSSWRRSRQDWFDTSTSPTRATASSATAPRRSRSCAIS